MRQEILDKLDQKEKELQNSVRESALRYKCVLRHICPDCGENLTDSKKWSWFQTKITSNCKCGFTYSRNLWPD